MNLEDFMKMPFWYCDIIALQPRLSCFSAIFLKLWNIHLWMSPFWYVPFQSRNRSFSTQSAAACRVAITWQLLKWCLLREILPELVITIFCLHLLHWLHQHLKSFHWQNLIYLALSCQSKVLMLLSKIFTI